MLTFEDYELVQNDEEKKIDFILQVIAEHKGSSAYKEAIAAEKYYDGENPTINNYEKIIYDMQGKAHVDMWTANHKIASSFFTFVIDQEVSYLLGNGVRFSNDKTKEKLGRDFDQDVMDALEYARTCGAAYALWDIDHINVFKFKEFAPVLGEENGSIMLGVRYWQLSPDKPLRVTLYEMDGYTEYIRPLGEKMKIKQKKRPYKIRRLSANDGTEITDGENYPGFPIVPLYANKAHRSFLVGKRNTVDALDLVTSNMVNNVDEGNLIYWVLTNCGGMDDIDDAKFIERLKTLHVAHADGEAGAGAEAHTVEAPFEGTKVTIDVLIDRLYDDFQAFDAKSLSARDMSATAIEAAYTRLDLKCDNIERQLTRFINGILELAGIDDAPTYERNPLINKTEATQNLLLQAAYLNEDYITKKLLAINGDLDQYDTVVKTRDEAAAIRFDEAEDQQEGAAE